MHEEEQEAQEANGKRLTMNTTFNIIGRVYKSHMLLDFFMLIAFDM